MLKIENLCKGFGKKTVLNNLSLTLNSGIYGLLGPNGAGKTTFIRCITQLYSIPDINAILYNGTPIKSQKNYLSHIGYLPQKFGLFRDLTVYEAMETLAIEKKLSCNIMKDEICRCVEAVNLSDRIKSKVKTLSGGMIKRLGIAQALLGDPEILIFDEPTAGLDPEERLRFKLIISELDRDKTVIISTHIVSDIEAMCDDVIILNHGSVVLEGSSQEIIKTAENKVYLVPQEEVKNIDGKHFIQSQYQDGERIVCRIICSKNMNYERTMPTLEDGYIYCLRRDEL